MARAPLPRFIADLQVTVVVAAADENEADARLDALADVVRDKLAATTVTRMPGQPKVVHIDLGEISAH